MSAGQRHLRAVTLARLGGDLLRHVSPLSTTAYSSSDATARRHETGTAAALIAAATAGVADPLLVDAGSRLIARGSGCLLGYYE